MNKSKKITPSRKAQRQKMIPLPSSRHKILDINDDLYMTL
jgi:hypothetical protein